MINVFQTVEYYLLLLISLSKDVEVGLHIN